MRQANIIYTKNGVTKEIGSIGYFFKKKDLLQSKYYYTFYRNEHDKMYIVDSDVEEVHFKNMKFDSKYVGDSIFQCENKNTKLIFDHCTFMGSQIYFDGGDINLSSCHFEDDVKEVHFANNSNIEVNFDEDAVLKPVLLSSSFVEKFKIAGKTNNVTFDNVLAQNLDFHNVDGLKIKHIKSSNMKVEDSTLLLSDSSCIVSNLTLENSHLTSSTILDLSGVEKIKMNSSLLTGKEEVRLKHASYYGMDEVRLVDSDFGCHQEKEVKREFLSVLQTVRELVNTSHGQLESSIINGMEKQKERVINVAIERIEKDYQKIENEIRDDIEQTPVKKYLKRK